MGAIARFVVDPAVSMRGYVSAGRARFSDAIAPLVVPVARLRAVLVEWDEALADQKRLEAAWIRLEHEAARSAGRRATHLAYVGQRRRKSRTGPALRSIGAVERNTSGRFSGADGMGAQAI